MLSEDASSAWLGQGAKAQTTKLASTSSALVTRPSRAVGKWPSCAMVGREAKSISAAKLHTRARLNSRAAFPLTLTTVIKRYDFGHGGTPSERFVQIDPR